MPSQLLSLPSQTSGVGGRSLRRRAHRAAADEGPACRCARRVDLRLGQRRADAGLTGLREVAVIDDAVAVVVDAVASLGQLVCNATGMPMAEVCNGKDDNCDGVIDNGNFPETGQTCICNGLTQAQIDAPAAPARRGASSAAARWALSAKAACYPRRRSATARTTTATA